MLSPYKVKVIRNDENGNPRGGVEKVEHFNDADGAEEFWAKKKAEYQTDSNGAKTGIRKYTVEVYTAGYKKQEKPEELFAKFHD